jgi:histidinol-phosphatase (PHP family)
VSLKDFHIHIEQGPYTVDWIKSFLEEAFKKGIDEIGISEHGHRFKQAAFLWQSEGFRGQWTGSEATEDIYEYIELIEKVKALGYPVKLGLEMDYIPERQEEIRAFVNEFPFDYVLGAVHWLGDFGFDHPDCRNQWGQKNVDEVHREYYNVLGKAINSGVFDGIAHPDVIKVFGYKAQKDMGDIYEKIALAIKNKGLCAEVSTAGIRKPVGEIYPGAHLMSFFAKHDIPIMINSDAHCPEDVGRDFEKAMDYVRSFGYNKLYYFEKRSKKPINL